MQTSVLVIRRKSEEQLRLEMAAQEIDEYSVFMAICDHIGHDKRGNAIYVRDENGYEVVREVADAVTTTADFGDDVQAHLAQEKVLDDNTQEIAEAFRAWLSHNG